MSSVVRSGRSAARNAALKRTAAGSGPPEARGRVGTGLDLEMGTAGPAMMTVCQYLELEPLEIRDNHRHDDGRAPPDHPAAIIGAGGCRPERRPP